MVGRLLPKIKKGSLDREDLNTFRPIANVAFQFGSNVIERNAACQVHHYLVLSNLYPKFQQSHNTNTAPLQVHNDIFKSTENKSEVILVLLDLSAAFDNIDHGILVTLTTNSVWLYGQSSSVLRVVHPESLSEGSNWLDGVPQGCVVGPPLFILYFAPLENVIKSHGLPYMISSDYLISISL